MLYWITKPFAKLIFAVYFRKIYLTHRERVPKGKPVILAANHPTAFIDPCLLASWLPQQLSFIARGDLYLTKPFVRKLYHWYGLTPVFRVDDAGYGHLKNNFDSFDRCHEALRQHKTLMILAEGRTKHEKRLRPIMKGTARLVFGALEKYPDLDIYVVPAGINYTNSDRFRDDVMVDFGEPIRAQDYLETYRQSPPKAVNQLTTKLTGALQRRVVHINLPEDEALAEQLFLLAKNERSEPVLPLAPADERPLATEIRLANFINHLPEPEKTALKEAAEKYATALMKNGVSDWGLLHRTTVSPLRKMGEALGWLPAFLGKTINLPPLFFGDRLSRKLAKSIEFRASIAVVSGGFGWVIYFLAWMLAAILSGKIWAMAGVSAMPLLGYFSLIYNEFREKNWQAEAASGVSGEEAGHLLELRKNVLCGIPTLNSRRKDIVCHPDGVG